MEFLTLYLGKMGTIISDRRAVNYFIAVVAVLFGLPYVVNANKMDGEVVNALVTIIQGVVILFGHLGLTKSWEKRLPSGLRYKDVLDYEMQIKDAIVSILYSDEPDLQGLRDLLLGLGFKSEK